MSAVVSWMVLREARNDLVAFVDAKIYFIKHLKIEMTIVHV
jgi:hypothetical protein